MKSVRPDTEREVEMHFASPLFRELGYHEEQEAAGFGIQVYQGATARSASRPTCSTSPMTGTTWRTGEPLVLVECKRSDQGPEGGGRPGAQLRAVGLARLLRDHRCARL